VPLQLVGYVALSAGTAVIIPIVGTILAVVDL
jgi:hypothetical protein